jgi:predicted transcriptional regulator
MKSYEFVEMFKEKNHLPSDYKAAQVLQISRSAMSNYKNGRP